MHKNKEKFFTKYILKTRAAAAGVEGETNRGGRPVFGDGSGVRPEGERSEGGLFAMPALAERQGGLTQKTLQRAGLHKKLCKEERMYLTRRFA